jgi:hypothetical protein
MQKVAFAVAFIIAVAVGAAHPAAAQTNTLPGDAGGISGAERQRVVAGIARELKGRYVFPDRGASAGDALLASERAGEFDSATSGDALTKALDARLAALLHDKHVRVRFSVEPFPPSPLSDQTPSAEEFEQFRRDAARFNYGIDKVQRLPGNVGYLDVREFPDATMMGATLAATMQFIGNTDALIVDLRNNHGGDPAAVVLLCSYFFPPWEPVHINDIFTRTRNSDSGETQQYWTTYVPGPLYVNKTVYVLTSTHTFSGGEEFAYDMQTQKRATLVGETTGGGANPGDLVAIDAHFQVFIPNGRAVNPITKTNWEGVGVKPDVTTAADEALSTAYLALLRAKVAASTNAREHELLAKLIDDVTKDPKSILSL